MSDDDFENSDFLDDSDKMRNGLFMIFADVVSDMKGTSLEKKQKYLELLGHLLYHISLAHKPLNEILSLSKIIFKREEINQYSIDYSLMEKYLLDYFKQVEKDEEERLYFESEVSESNEKILH